MHILNSYHSLLRLFLVVVYFNQLFYIMQTAETASCMFRQNLALCSPDVVNISSHYCGSISTTALYFIV